MKSLYPKVWPARTISYTQEKDIEDMMYSGQNSWISPPTAHCGAHPTLPHGWDHWWGEGELPTKVATPRWTVK